MTIILRPRALVFGLSLMLGIGASACRDKPGATGRIYVDVAANVVDRGGGALGDQTFNFCAIDSSWEHCGYVEIEKNCQLVTTDAQGRFSQRLEIYVGEGSGSRGCGGKSSLLSLHFVLGSANSEWSLSQAASEIPETFASTQSSITEPAEQTDGKGYRAVNPRFVVDSSASPLPETCLSSKNLTGSFGCSISGGKISGCSVSHQRGGSSVAILPLNDTAATFFTSNVISPRGSTTTVCTRGYRLTGAGAPNIQLVTAARFQ